MFLIFNNIPMVRLLIIVLGALSFSFGSNPIPTENTFLFCLKSTINPLQIERGENGVVVNNEELNIFMINNGVVDLEEWIPQATDMDRDGDVYLNRIYRVYLDESRSHSTVQSIALIHNIPVTLYAEHEFLHKPLYTPNDPALGNQCSIPAVKADFAWD